MNNEKEILIQELHDALKETLSVIKEVYGNSAYYMQADYQSTENNYPNWLFKAQAILDKAEKSISENNNSN